MLLNDPLRNLVARAVHQAVSEADSDKTGIWLCEWYAVAGANVLHILTGWYYDPTAGFSGFRIDRNPPEPVRHASGLPLATWPGWADLVEVEPQFNAHAWIESDTEIIDFSLKPFFWNDRSRSGQYVFNRIESHTADLQQKYEEQFPRLAESITRRAVELTAPAVLASANGTATHIFERIAGNWLDLADKLLTDYNDQQTL